MRDHALHQGLEEIYAKLMTHEETYLLVCELTIGGASNEVRLGQGRHLALT